MNKPSPIPVPRCAVCGEETTPDPESSFFGHVHRWGPKAHLWKMRDDDMRLVAENDARLMRERSKS